MTQVEAHVATASGGKYVRQLCKHWAHKLPVELEGDTGVVTFEGAVATMAAGAEEIHVTVSGQDHETVDRLKDVVAGHIDRFAFREAPLTYDWAWS